MYGKNVRVNITQKGCADFRDIQCTSSDSAKACSIGLFLDGVSFTYREIGTTNNQSNLKCRIAWKRPGVG